MREENDRILRKCMKRIIRVFVALGIIGIFANSIIYPIIVNQNEVALNSYSEKTYKYLNGIAENTIKEGENIDILEIINYKDPKMEDAPKVIRCEILYKGENVILEYDLDNNEGINYAYRASMWIKFSKELKIISQKPNFSSKEKYMEAVKQRLREESHGWSFVVIGVFFVLYLLYLDKKS